MRAKKSLVLPRNLSGEVLTRSEVRHRRKKWGQNFLRDPKILKKIADFAQIDPEDTVIEVGPGEGTLTKFLLERANRVIVVEKDKELSNLLKSRFEKEIVGGKLQVINDDILNYESRIKNYVLVGNIPYYITGALFKKALEAVNQPKSITFVVQKEVADRIMGSHFAPLSGASRDKSRWKESVLSISIKVYGTLKYGGVIKAGSFYPAPKVDSAIIAVRNVNNKRFKEEKIEEEKFFKILKAGFAHKRKLLIRNLNMVSKSDFDTLKLRTVFEKCGISEKARAENLSVDDWIRLTKKLEIKFSP